MCSSSPLWGIRLRQLGCLVSFNCQSRHPLRLCIFPQGAVWRWGFKVFGCFQLISSADNIEATGNEFVVSNSQKFSMVVLMEYLGYTILYDFTSYGSFCWFFWVCQQRALISMSKAISHSPRHEVFSGMHYYLWIISWELRRFWFYILPFMSTA